MCSRMMILLLPQLLIMWMTQMNLHTVTLHRTTTAISPRTAIDIFIPT